MKGKIVKWFSRGRYGFIEIEDGSNVFFHLNDCLTKDYLPSIGDTLEFEVQRVPKGLRAVNIKLLS